MEKEEMIRALLKPINGASVVILGVYTFVWGLWVSAPWWDVFAEGELYGMLAVVAPELFWGLVAVICGLAITWGVFHRSFRALIIASSIGYWHWLMIATFYFLGSATSTGGITALTFAVYAGYVYVNMKINGKAIVIMDQERDL